MYISNLSLTLSVLIMLTFKLQKKNGSVKNEQKCDVTICFCSMTNLILYCIRSSADSHF